MEKMAWDMEDKAHMRVCVCVCVCLIAQSCPTLCDLMNCSPPGSSVHGNSSDKNTGVGCHALLQGIFPTKGSNTGLLRYRRILYRLSHKVAIKSYEKVIEAIFTKRGPGLGSFSRADRGIGGVRPVAPPTWLVSNFLVRPASS